MNEIADVAIVGAGAAGLSAALVLGRCRRSVVLSVAIYGTMDRMLKVVHAKTGGDLNAVEPLRFMTAVPEHACQL